MKLSEFKNIINEPVLPKASTVPLFFPVTMAKFITEININQDLNIICERLLEIITKYYPQTDMQTLKTFINNKVKIVDNDDKTLLIWPCEDGCILFQTTEDDNDKLEYVHQNEYIRDLAFKAIQTTYVVIFDQWNWITVPSDSESFIMKVMLTDTKHNIQRNFIIKVQKDVYFQPEYFLNLSNIYGYNTVIIKEVTDSYPHQEYYYTIINGKLLLERMTRS